MHSYEFLSTIWRAQPLYVVDGDTVDLFVDRGFHHYNKERFRFLDIDTDELRDRDPEKRASAKEAKAMVQDLLDTFEKTWDVNLKTWPLRIESAPDGDPDNFGRYLARIFFKVEKDGEVVELSLNAELLREGLAKPYVK